MNVNYYMKKFGVSATDIKGMAKAYASDFPESVAELAMTAVSSQQNEINELNKSQSTLLNNHLFLYDVLNNSEEGVKSKLNTRYTPIPDNLSFKDQKITDLLSK